MVSHVTAAIDAATNLICGFLPKLLWLFGSLLPAALIDLKTASNCPKTQNLIRIWRKTFVNRQHQKRLCQEANWFMAFAYTKCMRRFGFIADAVVYYYSWFQLFSLKHICLYILVVCLLVELSVFYLQRFCFKALQIAIYANRRVFCCAVCGAFNFKIKHKLQLKCWEMSTFAWK